MIQALNYLGTTGSNSWGGGGAEYRQSDRQLGLENQRTEISQRALIELGRALHATNL